MTNTRSLIFASLTLFAELCRADPPKQRLPVLGWSKDQIVAEFGKPEFAPNENYGVHNQNPKAEELAYGFMVTFVGNKVVAIGYFRGFSTNSKTLTDVEIGQILAANGNSWIVDAPVLDAGREFREWHRSDNSARAECYPDNGRLYIWTPAYEHSGVVQPKDAFGGFMGLFETGSFRPHWLNRAASTSSSSRDSARISELENELKKLKGSQGSAPSTAGTLTREVAAKLVAPSYPRSLDRVCFSDQGLQRAQADGLLAEKTVMSIMTVYEFTHKAKQLLGPQIPQSVSRDERGQLCLSIAALREQFEAITGVAMGPLPNTASIEYTTRYLSSSPILDKLRPYIYAGNKQSADAQLYDDGWRLVRH